MARRLTTSTAAWSSARSDFMNLSRAGRGEEKIAHLDPRPRTQGLPAAPVPGPGLDGEAPCLARPLEAARQREPAHRADRGQRLAAEAQGRDARRSSVGAAWRWRGARRPTRARRHACRDRRPSTAMSVRPPSCKSASMRVAPGVERVLDQLLDRAGRALDHLAGGDRLTRLEGRTRMLIARGSLRDRRARGACRPRPRAGRRDRRREDRRR